MSVQPIELYNPEARDWVVDIATTSVAKVIDVSDGPKQWATAVCIDYLVRGEPDMPILEIEPELKVAWLSPGEIATIHDCVLGAVDTLQQEGYFNN